MNCNLRCKHCGSSCEGPLPDELTTEEALQLCDQLGELGLRKITLSGGEPFTRPDWHLLVERLTQHKIITCILSNGWLISDDIIDKALKAGVNNIGMSVDGIEETHDFIRKKGSFNSILRSMKKMKEKNLSSAAVTTISRKNIDELPRIKEILIDSKVKDWQLQIAMPMGNMLDYPDWILDPGDIGKIIDFTYDTFQEGRIRAHLGDNIGYFNMKEVEIRKNTRKSPYNMGLWGGCPAGRRVIGIRCNGGIMGCLSTRDDRYIEGNIRETPLKTIWESKHNFKWNRDLKKDDLTGFCSICQYGAYCCAGCSSVKIMNFDSLTENHFCAYYAAVKKEKESIWKIDDLKVLNQKGRKALDDQQPQMAELYISRALHIQPQNVTLLNLLGFIHYKLENYPQCEESNRKALELDPQNAYSHKGLGICLTKRGQLDAGIDSLKKAIRLADDSFMDPYYDLAVVYWENQRNNEALAILQEGRERSEPFREKSRELYEKIKTSQ
ncbi:MAG: radical SAM protein [bacterium]|nr:radical SAM protein [bacterium]